MSDLVKKSIDNVSDELIEIGQKLHENPETTNQEVFACDLLSNYLKEQGFKVEVGVCRHHTAFTATYDTFIKGPVVAITAEYDALQDLGHACGHNLIAISSIGAAISLRDNLKYGRVVVYGTPGEEGGDNGSSKASFVRDGYFDNVDFSISVHPGGTTSPTGNFIACRVLDIEFFGKPSHAASQPELGINALDSLINFYNQINSFRQQLPSSCKIHGIITSGGSAANIIPEYTSARFFIRAETKKQLNSLYEKFCIIAKASASGSFCTVLVSGVQNIVEDNVVVSSFDEVIINEFKKLGEQIVYRTSSFGSSDVGNVSYVVPTVHPTIKIGDDDLIFHSKEFAIAANSKLGYEAALKASVAIAKTCIKIFEEADLLELIKKEHIKSVGKKGLL